MLRAISVVAGLSLLAGAAAAQTRPDQVKFRALYKELIETDTSLPSGSCTLAAERMAAHLKQAGFPDSDLHLFAAPGHPKEGGLVAILPGTDAGAKPMLLLAHIDVVAARRAETLQRLAAALAARSGSAFPSAAITLDGWMENALLAEPATVVEDRYRDLLRESRPRDAAAGRTLNGPHLTDLQVTYAPKAMPARDASTGEQKALLIGLVLAHAGLVAQMTGITPLLLLDEVVAHLDPDRRRALFDELGRLGAQVWMTGADPAAFADVGPGADLFRVEGGTIARCG